MERKYINWIGILVGLVAFILGIVILFTDVKLLGIGSSLTELKDELNNDIIGQDWITDESGNPLTRGDFAGTFNAILFTQISGWSALILGMLSMILFGVFTLEEGGKLNTSMGESKYWLSEGIAAITISLIAIIVGFVIKGNVVDTYLEELIAAGVTI